MSRLGVSTSRLELGPVQICALAALALDELLGPSPQTMEPLERRLRRHRIRCGLATRVCRWIGLHTSLLWYSNMSLLYHTALLSPAQPCLECFSSAG